MSMACALACFFLTVVHPVTQPNIFRRPIDKIKEVLGQMDEDLFIDEHAHAAESLNLIMLYLFFFVSNT